MRKNKPDQILTYDDILRGEQPIPENFGEIIVHYWRPIAERVLCDTTQLQVEAIRSAINPATLEMRETLVMLLLDDEFKLVGPYVLGIGTDEEVPFNRKELLRTAMVVPGVTQIVLGHNHPDGYVHPSKEDVDGANSLFHALGICGLHLHDSIIITREDHYSLQENHLIRA